MESKKHYVNLILEGVHGDALISAAMSNKRTLKAEAQIRLEESLNTFLSDKALEEVTNKAKK